jgi:hypothetical protein
MALVVGGPSVIVGACWTTIEKFCVVAGLIPLLAVTAPV